MEDNCFSDKEDNCFPNEIKNSLIPSIFANTYDTVLDENVLLHTGMWIYDITCRCCGQVVFTGDSEECFKWFDVGRYPFNN